MIMERKLEFLQSMTVEKFKKDLGAKKLEVLKNPHTQKLFFTCGGETGAVSSKGVPKNSPMISKVIGEEGEFFLLHEEGTGGAPVIATF